MIRILRRYMKFGFVLLLPAYFTILVNSVVNKHTHILPNGFVLTHAHPYDSSDAGFPKKHHHSEKEFFFFQSFSISDYNTADNDVVFQKISKPCQVFIISQIENVTLGVFSADNPRRGPPSAC